MKVGIEVGKGTMEVNLKEEVMEYLQSKEGKTKAISNLETKFQNFLTRNISFIGEWSIADFLSNIDK
jgi:hypothetical protein